MNKHIKLILLKCELLGVIITEIILSIAWQIVRLALQFTCKAYVDTLKGYIMSKIVLLSYRGPVKNSRER